MNEQENVFPEQVPNEPKKNNKKFILGGLAVLVIAAVAVLLVWKFTQGKGEKIENATEPKTLNNPVEVYQTTIDDGFKLLKNSISELENVNFNTVKPVEIALNTKLTTSMSDLAIFNGFELKSKIGMDLNAKKMNLDLNLNKNGKGIDATLAILNNHGYLKSPSLIDKTLDLGVIEDIDDMFLTVDMPEIDVKDLEYIIDAYQNVFKNAITDKDCTTSNTKEGKIFTYNITGDLLKRLMNNFADTTLNDSKLLGILAKFTDVSTSELKSAFKELKEEDFSDFEAGKFVIETNKNEIASGYLEAEGSKILEFTNNNGEVVITIGVTDSNKAIITVKENSFKLEFKEDKTAVELNVTGSDTNCSLAFNIKEDDNYITVNADLKNINNSKNKISADGTLKVKGKVESENIDLNLEGSFSVAEKDLSKFDTTGAIDVNTISEEDKNKFSSNLMQIMNDLGLSSLLN